MNKRILVTYATRAGSTVEVAQTIGAVLDARGFAVHVKPIKGNPNVDGYQAVVIGSAIRMNAWLPEALDFIQNNEEELNRIPTAIFTVHLLNTANDPDSRRARQAYTIPVLEILAPVHEVFFNGKMDYAKLSFFDRLMAKAVEKQTNIKPGDFRDWDKIRAWAQIVLA